MLARFKAFGLRSLNKIRLMNLSKDKINSVCKRNLPRLASTGNGYERMDDNHSNSESHKGPNYSADQFLSELSNGANYLLTGLVGSAIVLERKYEIVKNVTEVLSTTLSSALVVQAKGHEQVEDASTMPDDLPRQSAAKPHKHNPEPDLRKSYNFIANACESAIPSVVQIAVYQDDPYFGDQIKVSAGSGFVVSNDKKSSSLVLTNAHVVDNYERVQVETLAGKKLVGIVECVDNGIDLASIRIDDCSMPALEFESSKDVRVGEFVVAIGYPFNLNSNSVTAGIISSLTFSGKEIGLSEIKYIQTDCSIHCGNSGGPLLALNGKVIGINTFKLAESGMNLALPSDYAMKFIGAAKKISTNNRKTSMAKDTVVNREKTLGATMLALTPETLDQLRERGMKLDKVKHGFLLVRVLSGSIAEKSGLRQGDVMVELNDRKTPSAEEVRRTIDQSSSLSMLIVRADQKIKINVKF